MPDETCFPRGVPGRDDDIAHDGLARIVNESKAPRAFWAHPSRILQTSDNRWNFDVTNTAGKVFLGELNGQLLGIQDDRHLITVAGSRAGKGVSAIIPNLIFYPGSVLVIDPKGENARRTATRRGHGSAAVRKGLGQDVFVLDPFGESGCAKTHQFNPLDMIDPAGPTAVDDAALIAEALIIQEEGPGRHFSSAARNFLRGLILFVCTEVDSQSRNLNAVRDFLTLAPKAFGGLLTDMSKESRCEGVIRRAANSLLAKEEREKSGVVSTAIEQTDFLDSKGLAHSLQRSDFNLRDLKRKPTSVYLCLPARFMATHSRWLRIIINLAVAAMEQEKTVPPHRVLFIMDEFAILDYLPSVEKAAGQIAGFHATLWPILQDLSQLKSIYKDRWETFLGNAGLMQFFGNSNDLSTLEYLSKRLGKTTIAHVTQGEISTLQSASGFTGRSVQLQQTELMTPEEIGGCFSRQSHAQLLLWPGYAPIAIDRAVYWDTRAHPYFQGTFEP
jgi:type IV secretion system protein VirD4